MAFIYVTLTILELFPLVFSIIYLYLIVHKLKGGLPRWLRWQRIHLQCGRPGFNLWIGKIPWRRAWQPTPVFLPGMERGAWWATVHRVTKCQTQLSEWTHTHFTLWDGVGSHGLVWRYLRMGGKSQPSGWSFGLLLFMPRLGSAY